MIKVLNVLKTPSRQIVRSLSSTQQPPTYAKESKWSYRHGESYGQRLIGATLYERLEDMVSQKPNDVLYKFCLTQEQFTFAEFKQRVDNMAQSMLKQGYKRGDRLAVMLPNCPEYALTTVAAASIGVTCVLLNPAYQLVEIEYMLKLTKSRGIVMLDDFKTLKHYEILTKICPEMLETTSGAEINSKNLPHFKHVFLVQNKLCKDATAHSYKGSLPFSQLLNHSGVNVERPYVDMHDDFAILFTSGSTGFPKGVPMSQHTIINSATIEQYYCGIPESSKVSNIPIPLFHVFGLCVGVVSGITTGNKIVYPNFFPESTSILKSIQDERCTALKGAPVIFIDMMNHPDFKKYDLSSLEYILLGASPVPKDVLIKMKKALNLKHIIVGYGMTESGTIGSVTRAVDVTISEKFGYESLGQGLPFQEIKIVDPKTGNMVPRNVDGEICLRGFNIMKGYLDDPKKTAETIDPNGWLKTGDIGCMDEQGYIYYKTRCKELVIRGGVNIYPAEIERFLRTNDKIFDCYVFGVPDERVGEELCVWIKLKSGMQMTADEVKEFCKGNVAYFKIPRYVKFVDSFPINATGKAQKFKMQATMAKELGPNKQ